MTPSQIAPQHELQKEALYCLWESSSVCRYANRHAPFESKNTNWIIVGPQSRTHLSKRVGDNWQIDECKLQKHIDYGHNRTSSDIWHRQFNCFRTSGFFYFVRIRDDTLFNNLCRAFYAQTGTKCPKMVS